MFWESVNAWYDKAREIALLSLPFLGFGLIRRWYALVLALGLDGSASFLHQGALTVNSFAECGFLLVLVALARRFAPLYRRGAFVAGSAAALSCGTLVAFLGTLAWPSAALVVCGEVLMAAGFTTLFIVWLELYGCVAPMRIAVAYAASFVMCCAVWEILRQFAPPSSVVIACTLPFASIAMLIAGFRTVPETHLPQRDSARPSLASMGRLVAWIAILSFAFGIADGLTSSSLQEVSYLGRLLPNAVILVGVLFFRRVFDLGVTYRITLPLVIVGFLVLLLADDDPTTAQFFLSAGSESFLALAFIVVCCSAYRHRASAAYACAIVFAVHAVFVRIGAVTSVAVLRTGAADQGLPYGAILVLAVLVFAASILVFRERDFYLQWGGAGITPAAANEEGRLRAVVDALAVSAKLSARERDIALLMVRGLSNADIASELFIAPGTVRTHVSRIYAKLDVHSRDEFLAVLQARGVDVGA